MLQDPLVNEGSDGDGRRSRNTRLVEFDIATGQSTAQYIYQLESRITLNNITLDTMMISPPPARDAISA